MSRQDVYKVLAELKKEGLIEKHLSKPTMFNAPPIKDTFSILINRKNKEFVTLKEKTNKIIDDFEDCSVKRKDENSEMILIPENEALLFRLLRAVDNSKQKIDIISSGKPSQRGLLMADALERASKRNVKIRYIADKSEVTNMQSGILQNASQNNFCIKKITHKSPIAKIRIFDNKEIFVTLFPFKDFTKSPALWSNNSNFIALFQEYFEKTWHTEEECQLKSASHLG